MANSLNKSAGDTVLALATPVVWDDPTVPMSAALWSDVSVQIDGSPVGQTVSFSLDGVTWYPATVTNKGTFAAVTTIGAAGVYQLPGSCLIKITGGTPGTKYTIRAGS